MSFILIGLCTVIAICAILYSFGILSLAFQPIDKMPWREFTRVIGEGIGVVFVLAILAVIIVIFWVIGCAVHHIFEGIKQI